MIRKIQKQNITKVPKKDYHKPKLTIFGSINAITESTANGPTSDGGGKGQLSMGS